MKTKRVPYFTHVLCSPLEALQLLVYLQGQKSPLCFDIEYE